MKHTGKIIAPLKRCVKQSERSPKKKKFRQKKNESSEKEKKRVKNYKIIYCLKTLSEEKSQEKLAIFLSLRFYIVKKEKFPCSLLFFFFSFAFI